MKQWLQELSQIGLFSVGHLFDMRSMRLGDDPHLVGLSTGVRAPHGKVIRLVMPPLNEERRKELVKLVKKFAEEGKIAVRNIRRDAIEHLKKSEKSEHFSEDDRKRAETDVQKMTDKYVKDMDGLVTQKEKEIMEV